MVRPLHAEAPTAAATDWNEIVGLYDLLLTLTPSPVVALNRTVALAMRDGPESALTALDALLADGALDGYQLAHAARADFCRRVFRAAQRGGVADDRRSDRKRSGADARRTPPRDDRC